MSWRAGTVLAASALQLTVVTAQFASTTPAQQLAYMFQRTGLDAFAAAEPSGTGAFVAAVYIGGDMLVVRARHPAERELTALIESRRFLDVYSRLSATPTPEEKLSVVDANANGLLAATRGSGHVDRLRAGTGREIVLNSDFEAQGMTADEYDAAVAKADSRYARALGVLLSAAGR